MLRPSCRTEIGSSSARLPGRPIVRPVGALSPVVLFQTEIIHVGDRCRVRTVAVGRHYHTQFVRLKPVIYARVLLGDRDFEVTPLSV